MSTEIDNKIDTALQLVADKPDKMLSETKKIRAALNKDLSELETARKNVKTEIMQPYLDFEKIYKEKISDKYKNADKILKNRIDKAENNIKSDRAIKLKQYFEEYCKAENVTDIKFEDMPLKINISGSDKSYREKIKSWIDKIKQDLAVINTSKDEQTRVEILIDYKRDFDVNRAILDHDKKLREIAKLKEAETTPIDENDITAPEVTEDNIIYEMSFTVRGTKTQLKELKQYLIENKLI
ncbi:MAG: DUF1351 domain-containing protein [Bacteroidales bacterium]|nr:DUF1351 domain-containing protein [Bacteroidales bacterium]